LADTELGGPKTGKNHGEETSESFDGEDFFSVGVAGSDCCHEIHPEDVDLILVTFEGGRYGMFCSFAEGIVRILDPFAEVFMSKDFADVENVLSSLFFIVPFVQLDYRHTT
jgi:hypothetical protein